MEGSAGRGLGVNIVGYLTAQFGLGESARAYASALRSQGVAVSLFDVDLGIPHERKQSSSDSLIEQQLPFPVTLLFVNPDYLGKALAQVLPVAPQRGMLIGCWFWELEKLPQSWAPALCDLDAVMVASEFVGQAVRNAGDTPLLRVPLPLGPRLDAGLQRQDFGVDADAFVFLFTFDFSSWVDRKNPIAVIRAFKQAFPVERRAVQLVLKSSNGRRHELWFSQVLQEINGDERIIFRDDIIDRPCLVSLQRCADAYVSLHRAEGLGMGMAECMGLGKPVIATGWSGNLDFMNADCAALVEYSLVPVPVESYPDANGQRWAEPSIEDAAKWMRRLADDPEFSRSLGERGRRHVEKVLSPEVATIEFVKGLRDVGLLSVAQMFNENMREENS